MRRSVLGRTVLGRWARVGGLVATVALAAGCSLVGGGDSGQGGERKVVLVTHNSFNPPKELLEDFQKRTGVKLEVRASGDGGALTNQLVLTKANPLGDVAFGVDSTFASRALEEGVFQPYRGPEADKGPQRYAPQGNQDRLTAVDVGDVCLNVDTGWFQQRGVAEPRTLDDLTQPQYKDLLVAEDPATSSPGLAFLLATVAKYGENGYADYWKRLRDNGLKVTSGWEEAYNQDFTAGSGKGQRPVVVSYASSPAFTIGDDGKPRTKALLDTCYRQVEYAGVLAGAKNVDDARKVVDFLVSPEFQAKVAESMYVYPAREGVALPASWQQAAPLPERSAELPADEVRAGRERWVEQWRKTVRG
ncbi:thiamine transport system substrate-binding protein [Streptoalloteichus tenebrarius]|uniref:Thiamine transport system substrate-binding protein n=1 Tax=Streptoalloteichus tenebrarius (strain ATCC 17920 / DSM 40477 / JCM 4838 / CBS 697.72 / NBRC 16177 / NCIMB 11028 / NRRL B-12390 / A12253. 1 / ISP 5477) TaxID=1933 RepID=A0ABT1HTP9_STRSD|nr:thiamine ABC transporter substrate-binding protein [Streptoalloteichus tenebrarius]MCP2258902.1 thiamine transport system substrate-binding protein [Streptoalloteichus tenebrarius]BFF01110.1 thiamine ABC transporter substrate-binding protein [Streptoalloteichus tenebrarius]